MTPKDPHRDPKDAAKRVKGHAGASPDADAKREVDDDDDAAEAPPPPRPTLSMERNTAPLLLLLRMLLKFLLWLLLFWLGGRRWVVRVLLRGDRKVVGAPADVAAPAADAV